MGGVASLRFSMYQRYGKQASKHVTNCCRHLTTIMGGGTYPLPTPHPNESILCGLKIVCTIYGCRSGPLKCKLCELDCKPRGTHSSGDPFREGVTKALQY
jgi:hypothetical protein